MTPEEVVRAAMTALTSLEIDQAMAYFADDATFLPGFSFPTCSGSTEIRKFFEASRGVITKLDVEFVNLAVAGERRIDRARRSNDPQRKADRSTGYGRV
jgi:ketosteroid isomerase-like protein